MTSSWKVASVLGVITGILSLVSLLWQLWDFGPIAPFRLMLEYYQQFLNVLLGWADAPLKTFMHRIQNWTNVTLSLNPGWKHLFVLMWLYFSTDAKITWPARKGFAAFSFLLGGVLALSASIALGADSAFGGTPNLFTAALPVAAFFLFSMLRGVWSATFSLSTPSFDASGKTWPQIFAYSFFNYSLPTLAVGVAVLLVGWGLYDQGLIPHEIHFDTFILSVFVMVLAVYWLARGAFLATYRREGDESWRHRFKRSGSTYLSFLMLTTISGVVLFVVLNAGLRVVGL